MSSLVKIKQNNSVTEFLIEPDSHTNSSVLNFLNEKGFFMTAPCGSIGICGGCKIFLISGTLKMLSDNSIINGPAYLKSCRLTFSSGDCEIEIPEKITKKSLSSRTGQIGDLFDSIRICSAGSPSTHKYGLAIDIGTTNMSIILISLEYGRIICEKHVINSQIAFAGDVVSRIDLCYRDKAMISVLEACVVEKSIIPTLDLILKETLVNPDDISKIVISGNTTMLHLLCGKDPSSMGTYPFTPLFTESIETTFDKITMHSNCEKAIRAKTTLMPGFSAFVGADILSGVYALDLIKTTGNFLLVDIGTNGEITLKHNGGLLVTSTAAGPVFEGFGLDCGLTAIDGAISEFYMHDSEIRFKTINNEEAIGICGSGYISFLSTARKASIIDTLGKFKNGDKELRVKGTSIVITEADIARILQAKAAISSGIKIVLKNAKLTEQDIKKVYLAGSFGSNLRKEYAIGSGILGNFNVSQIECVGNSSLAGCYKYILQNSPSKELTKIKSLGLTLNLNEDPDFSDTYIDSLFLN
ncbi:MAG TPA: hypothetical protein DD381_11160 [Lentisphaeria bacterium]|nr:MAG: hypothetical protein A2X47_00440 [Lentisphaerae bacterium GWF2_38_69]HBM16887.1 hypothetical protein [Lentisphaeria bacterium]